MHYWGFNTVYSILSSSIRIDGDLYMPVSNKRTNELATLAQKHVVRVHRCKDQSQKTNDSGERYPLLITNSNITPQNTFKTMEHYLSITQLDREFVLLLDGITDVGNIAAIFRSAYNFGVTCIVMSNKTGGDVPILIRRSAGYYLKANVVRETNISQVIQILKKTIFGYTGPTLLASRYPMFPSMRRGARLLLGTSTVVCERVQSSCVIFLLLFRNERSASH